MRELPRRVGRRAGTATRPDHTDDRVALADVVVQQPQQGVGPRLLAKAALHPQFKAARLQVVRDRIARRAELARYRRKKDAERPRHRLLPVQDRQFDRKPAGNATLETGRLRHLGATIEAHVFGFGAGSRKGVPSLPARSLSARFSSLRALPAGASG